ncbi:MAG: alpha/beta fold hydrolase [Kiritimatiellae bacterium]|nr:alpha/beta fold hydrolase [Kiritimatiellia bacterium]MCO5068947.1 lysophospholipase [Kiritimatiellia bacterium]
MSLVHVILGIGIALLAARSGYPAWTQFRAEREARGAVRGAEGVRPGMQAYAVGDGEIALIFVHGFASSPAVFREMAPALGERGFDCRAIRLPGFGESLDRMASVSEDDWQRAVADAVTRARADGKKVWLVGHSMGGALSIEHVLRHPGTVEGVVLLAPLIEVSSRRSLGLPPEALHRFARGVLPRDTILETAFPVDLHARAEGIDELRDRFLPISVYDAMFRVAAFVSPRAEEVRVPVLMILPGRDKIVSVRASREYFDAVGSARKLLVEEKNAGHVLPLDYGWQDAVQCVQEFVRAGGREDAREENWL